VTKVNDDHVVCKLSRNITAKFDYIKNLDGLVQLNSVVFGKIKKIDNKNVKLDISLNCLKQLTQIAILQQEQVVNLEFLSWVSVEFDKIKQLFSHLDNK